MNPRLTVITSCFNGARFLPDAIESVLAQTMPDFEFLIINDGSTDDTAEILERYRQQDSRITVITQENRGIARSLNRAITEAKTELIAHIDADDRALPNWLERQLTFLEQHRENSVVSSHSFIINADGKRLGKGGNPVDVKRGLADRNPKLFLEIIHSTVLMRKSKLMEVGCYREGLSPYEDRDLWGRLATSGQLLACNPERLIEGRIHFSSVTMKKRSESTIWANRSIDVNILRRLDGLPELTPEETKIWFESRPLNQRIRTWQKATYGRYFMLAARHYAERRWLHFAGAMTIATAIRPIYVPIRAIKKAF
jgi:glycosyltransferase involved in cell wall biosynthesis